MRDGESASRRQGLGFSVDLNLRANGLVGCRARAMPALIDLDRIGAYDRRDFWDAGAP